jgi:hypothetical protein
MKFSHKLTYALNRLHTKNHKKISLYVKVMYKILWQNRLNYFGSSALMIIMQLSLSQRTSNGTTHWSVGSPPDTTTVQQDRSRFTSHEGEFTIIEQLIHF